MFFFLLLRIIAAFFSSTTSFPSQRGAFVHPWPNSTSESDQSSVDCCKMQSLQLLNCWTCMIIKRWKYNPHRETLFPVRVCVLCARACVCVCVCVRACVRACVCVPCAARSKLTSKGHFWVLVRPNDQIHIKHVKKKKQAGLKSIHFKHSLCLKVNENSWRKLCVNILS